MQNLIHSIYFSNDFSKTATHHHDCHQILYIVEGEAEFFINSERYIASGGNIVLFSRYENHAINILSDSYQRFILRINPGSNLENQKLFSLLFNRPVGFHNVINIAGQEKTFENIFQSLLKEYKNEPVLFHDMQSALLNQLLISLCRVIPKSEDYFKEKNVNFVLTLQKDFEENYRQNYRLDELAKKYGLSVSALSHQFKKITGMSVMEYLQFCRMANAKNLLKKTDLSVKEIVEICGFSDESNFSRTFKKLNNITPTHFRKSQNR